MRSLIELLLRAWFAASLFTLCIDGSLAAAEPVTVYLQSGRSFSGYIDSDTTRHELVLRFESGGSALWRPISWERVVAADYEGRRLSAEELRRLTPQLQSTQPEVVTALPVDAAPITYVQPATSEQQAGADRVHSIAVRAELANWNAGVEMDGLILTVWPLNAGGEVLPVSGTVEVELVGLRPASARSIYSYARGNPFPRMGMWTQSVQADQIGHAGAQFKLPFQAIQPEFDTQFAPYGMVQVKMAIPGHGTFAVTENLVRLRPYSPLRDVREQLHLRRFFPQEQLTRTQ